LSSLQTVSAEV